MAEYKLYNKQELCFTDVTDFTDFQAIGNYPMYKRYKSVYRVVETVIDEQYRSFLAQPVYSDLEDQIKWYVPEWKEIPQKYIDMPEEKKRIYDDIKEKTIAHYKDAILRTTGEDRLILKGAIKYIDNERIFCYDNKVVLVAWGMTLDTNKHQAIGTAFYFDSYVEKRKITWEGGEHGSVLAEDRYMNFPIDNVLGNKDIPSPVADLGFEFVSWEPDPNGYRVTHDVVFTAQYKEKPIVISESENVIVAEEPKAPTMANCRFVSDERGTLSGPTQCLKPIGSKINAEEIPSVKPKRRYIFTGWNVPIDCIIKGDTVFEAQYEKRQPWYKRLIHWLKRNWKWSRWILLMLLVFLLLLLFFRCCRSCSNLRHRAEPVFDGQDSSWITDDPNTGHDGGIYDPGDPYTSVPTPPNYDDVLPPEEGVLPPVNSNPVTQPGNPTIFDNKLNILMENENKSVMEFAKAFKEKYPDAKYKIVYYDDVVKRIQIEIPPQERNRLKQEIPRKFAPEYHLFVFDEALFEGSYVPKDPAFSDNGKNWYLKAVHAPQAWNITRGSEKVIVAIVDNGFNLVHPELSNKVFMPYNVWKHSSNVRAQKVDHGTHVAGIALAMADNHMGMCGIAPNCKFMPIQVADDQGRMTTTSVLDGILYALYQGADVINVSLGEQFTGLENYSESQQQMLINSHFKEEERLWLEIMRIAVKHHATIVVAAGNDNILAGVDPLNRPEQFITVSAVDKSIASLNKANFSNYGFYSTISAPGVDIYSCVGKNSYTIMNGTSMSAPIVTGTVALMKSIDKSLSTQKIICILQNSGMQTQGNIGKLVQIDKALQLVKADRNLDCIPINNGNSNSSMDADKGSANDRRNQLEHERDRLQNELNRVNRELEQLKKSR